MGFKAELEIFDGPLDLMLHLIKEHKLDIFDLDIQVLVEQYANYLSRLETLQLEIEADYLHEFATLIEYKSKKLLPKEQASIDEDYEEDPKERLVKRLIEYQKFKDVSNQLSLRFQERNMQLAKPISSFQEADFEDEDKIEGNPNDLLKAMNKLLRRISLQTPMDTKITEKEISVDERIVQLKERILNLEEVFSFEKLMEDCTNVHLFVVTFLSVLDLVRNAVIHFTIDEQDAIWFKKGRIDE